MHSIAAPSLCGDKQQPPTICQQDFTVPPRLRRSVLNVLLADAKEALKVVATGLKVFERQEVRDQGNECPYRLAQEGLPFVLPHVTRQRLAVPASFVLALLKER